MGKLHSKHACKRRENPEGDSFGVNAFISRRGVEDGTPEPRRKEFQKCEGIELKDGQISDHRCPLEVVLPPERVEGCERLLPYLNSDVTCRGHKRISIDDVECNVSVGEDNRHEWVFTLYDFDNSGKVTKEDMSSLMQSIYEVVDSSVNQSCNSKRKTLRVKLSVTPEPAARRKDGKHPATERDALRLSRIEPSHPDDRQPSHIRFLSSCGPASTDLTRNTVPKSLPVPRARSPHPSSPVAGHP